MKVWWSALLFVLPLNLGADQKSAGRIYEGPGRVIQELPSGDWRETAGTWERIWNPVRKAGGFFILIDRTRGMILALPETGGQSWLTHRAHGIWFPSAVFVLKSDEANGPKGTSMESKPKDSPPGDLGKDLPVNSVN